MVGTMGEDANTAGSINRERSSLDYLYGNYGNLSNIYNTKTTSWNYRYDSI